MPRKMNQCGFSIPWISSPSTESPKQKQKSKSHRPPFRPPGIASAPPQPKMKELETQNSNSNSNSNSNAPLVTQSNSHQSKSKPTNHTRHEQSISTPKAEPPTTTTTASVEKKMMFATSNKNIKAVTPASTTSLDPTDRNNNNNVSTIPLSNEDDADDVSTLHVDDKTVSVVTLAGDNRGVTMHVAGSHSTRNVTFTEKKDETGKAYVNSNIQSINNSIMSNGSINGRDPGVRVVLPQQPQNDSERPCSENRKGEVSIKRAERLPYQPVVRRRCLRGLFLEPSDSEADDKPRRHGCKFSCGDITKDKDAVTK